MDPLVARKTARTLEPYHGFVYFAPEPAERYAALGIEGFAGYFASRAAALGAVPAAVVVATFFNFEPGLVGQAIPAAWSAASPAAIGAARRAGASAALQRLLPAEALDGAAMAEAVTLARAAAAACGAPGRPLYAAHAALDWPDEPHMQLWHAITLLREHRGDGHVACLVEAGLDPCEALVLHAGLGAVPKEALQSTRGWTDEDWVGATRRLAERGLVGQDGALTPAGAEFRERIEARTDELAVGPWSVIGPERCERLRALVRPWSKAIVDGGTFGF